MAWPKGTPRSPETRAKIGDALRGREHGLAQRARIAEGQQKRFADPAEREAVSLRAKGYRHTADAKERISKAMRWHWAQKRAA